MRRLLPIATIAALAAAPAAVAGIWPGAGGDAGRSGLLSGVKGSAPFTPLWDATGQSDRNVQTSVVITGAGLDGKAPRVVYGTSDGKLHLRDLYTGQAVGSAAGIPVATHKNKDVFTGLAGSTAPVVATPPGGGFGQIYVVFNDRFGPTEPNPQSVTDEIVVARIDATTGKLQERKVIPGTAKYVVSSSPVLAPADEDGNRQLLFTATNVADWEKDNSVQAPKGAPKLFRVPITAADTDKALVDEEAVQASGTIAALHPTSSPTLLMVSNRSGAQPTAAVPFVTVSTGDITAPLKTYDSHELESCDDPFGLLCGPNTGPASPQLDKDAAINARSYVTTAAVPVTPSGLTPGVEGSKAAGASNVYVASFSVKTNKTTVHRLVLNDAGTAFVEAARSTAFPGRPSAQPLAISAAALEPGDARGSVVVATGRNLYALDAGDLSMGWKLDDADGLAPGNTGFTRTSPAIAGGHVFIARDNGRTLAVRLADGKPIADDDFRRASSSANAVESFGTPAVAPAGIAIFASDKGIFAYRSRCANDIGLSADAKGTLGTFAGDRISGSPAADTIDGKPGDDCLGGGDGDDTISGDQGEDRIEGGAGADGIQGGADGDTIEGQDGSDTIDGQDGADTIDGGGAVDVLKGGDGNDTLLGQAGRDRLYGDSDNDTLDGGAADDELRGGNGADTLRGGKGDDTLIGGNGNDLLESGPGAASLSGGQGDDTIDAVNGEVERIRCGSGIDSVRADAKDKLENCEYRLTASGRKAIRRRR